jgi:hypothetical protein
VQFTSMPALRRHTDPEPFTIVETGERADGSKLGTPGVTFFFEPRPEFMPPAKLPLNEVLAHIRENWSTDVWGSSMTWLTAITLWVEKLAGKTPKDWRTADLPYSRVDLSFLDELVESVGEEKILPQLLQAGRVMQRLAGCAELAGESYPWVRTDED